MGIAQKSLLDIENSEIYKYSPYKSLNAEQEKATYEILRRLYEINDASAKSLIQVVGGAGTGKTILAIYLIKLLTDINRNKDVWNAISENEYAVLVKKLAYKIGGVRKIGFVVPMKELRSTMKTIFNSVDGLSESMILAPEEVVDDYYDLLVVDEAHRLYRRKNLPGQQMYSRFDKINEKVLGDSFTGTEADLTELDWIIRSSRLQILFYDKLQAIRSADIGSTRFSDICAPRLYKSIQLTSQMRCEGGNGYYEYVKKILWGENLPIQEYDQVKDYTLKVLDSIEELFSVIRQQNDTHSLCKVVAGPGWSKEEAIEIASQKYAWAGSDLAKATANVVVSIHKVQGFDLNYAGVIFGKELYYDKAKGRIEVNKKELKDNLTKSSGDEAMREFILNIYLTLMTRGIHGTYLYVVDDDLREYLKLFLNQ